MFSSFPYFFRRITVSQLEWHRWVSVNEAITGHLFTLPLIPESCLSVRLEAMKNLENCD
jgi:hypothetical protein